MRQWGRLQCHNYVIWRYLCWTVLAKANFSQEILNYVNANCLFTNVIWNCGGRIDIYEVKQRKSKLQGSLKKVYRSGGTHSLFTNCIQLHLSSRIAPLNVNKSFTNNIKYRTGFKHYRFFHLFYSMKWLMPLPVCQSLTHYNCV